MPGLPHRRVNLFTEQWRKAPGWRFEVSDAGRARTLSGRLLRLELSRGKVYVRYTGADDDPKRRRAFAMASLVLEVFGGQPSGCGAIHLNGDAQDCSLRNLRPDASWRPKVADPAAGLAPVDADARERCQAVLSDAGIDPSLVFSLSNSGRVNWSVTDPCLVALDRAGVAPADVAAALGLKDWKVRNRLLTIGCRGSKKPDRIKGEVWRKTPGMRGRVSSLGRVCGDRGQLLHLSIARGRRRVALVADAGGRRDVAVGSLVLSAFRGSPIDQPARHLNGDLLDCALANLEPGERQIRANRPRGDHRWSKDEDALLKTVTSYEEAARLTGHTIAYARKRMAKLGIDLLPSPDTGKRRGQTADLTYRNLDALPGYVSLLAQAGLSDREVNLGLGITKHDPGRFDEMAAARRAVIDALHEMGCTTSQMMEAAGLSRTHVIRLLQALGHRDRRPEGWRTKLGPVDPRDGEEWAEIPGSPSIVSNMGRVATGDGHLMSTVVTAHGGHQIPIMLDGRRVTCRVGKLVLMAFRPELTLKRARRLNGDLGDDTLGNFVSYRTFKETVHTDAPPRPARGNLAGKSLGPARGSLPYLEPMYAEARKVVPAGIDDHIREDLISDMVVAVMEGRADTMRKAFKLARREYNEVMGVWREKSIDVALPGTENFTLLDVLSVSEEPA